jgi:ABC-type transporter Mla maintaining outer membrane lipid asymmetry permease subunit MlaE
MRPDRTPPLYRVLGQIGGATAMAGRTMLGLLGFFGALLISFGNIIAHPRRFRLNAVTQQFELLGIHSLGIIGLMSFLVGIVIAQQGAVQLQQFGAEVFTVNLIGRSSVKELGILMTAIMVAGRSGSAFAAQIGSMKLAEEVDAMRTIGVSPMEALVVPRVLAALLMMPLLGFYSAVIAIVGGGPVLLDLARDPPGHLRSADSRGRADDRPLADADQGPRLRFDHRPVGVLPGDAGGRQCRGGGPAHHRGRRPRHLPGDCTRCFLRGLLTSIGWL